MTKTKKPNTSLIPKVRNYLSTWPVGVRRTRVAITTGLSYWDMQRLSRLGYIAPINPATSRPYQRDAAGNYPHGVDWWRHNQEFERTAKPCKPYRPLSDEQRAKRAARGTAYNGIFPWSVQEHWHRMQESPMRQARHVAKRLGGKLDAVATLALPVYVTTKSELDTCRKVLTVLFGGEDPKWASDGSTSARMRRWLEYGWLPQGIRPLLSSGFGLRVLMLEMLIEPEFDAEGVIVKFHAVAPEDAEQKLTAIYGDNFSPRERYQEFVAQQAERDAATPAPEPELVGAE